MSGKAIRSDYVEIGVKVNANPLKDLVDQVNSLKEKFKGASGDDAFDKLKNNAKKCKPPLKDLSKSLKDLDGKLTDVSKKLGRGLVTSAKMAGAALASVGTALGTFVYKSVSAFADREQLIGGVETLFKDSAGVVQKNANEAYKAAGMSANEYMNTVTSFSASLIQSLGGDTSKAAQYAHTAIVDMSDNANKMGTDMSLIQNAYQGFAKQNYTIKSNSPICA